MKRAWGRHYMADERDELHRIPMTASQRVSRFWRTRWIGDQKATPHCVGFAWAGWLNAPPVQQFLDPSGIYYTAQHFDEWEGEDYDGTSVRGGAKVLKSLGMIQSYKWAFSAGPIVQALLEKGPVVIGVTWYGGMMRPDSKTFIAPTGQRLGGHAVLLDGVNTDYGFVRVKNSWGRDWGSNGRAGLMIDDLDDLIRDRGEACIGVEVRPRAR